MAWIQKLRYQQLAYTHATWGAKEQTTHHVRLLTMHSQLSRCPGTCLCCVSAIAIMAAFLHFYLYFCLLLTSTLVSYLSLSVFIIYEKHNYVIHHNMRINVLPVNSNLVPILSPVHHLFSIILPHFSRIRFNITTFNFFTSHSQNQDSRHTMRPQTKKDIHTIMP